MPKSMSAAVPPGPPGKRGGRRRIRLATGLLVLVAVAAYGVCQLKLNMVPKPGCTVTAGGRSLKLEPDQAANASTIAAVADSRNLPERALTIALATAIQESALHNISRGDRDSVGLFQQRPSQGWGTAVQIMDPVYASNEFFDGLVRIKGYSRLPLTVAAQEVQRSGFPQAYAKHETDAALLSSVLTGRQSAALTCVTSAAAGGERTLAGGDLATVRARLRREFGSQVKPVTSPAAASAASGEASGGRARAGAGAVNGRPAPLSSSATSPGSGAGSGAGSGSGSGAQARTTVRTVSVDSAGGGGEAEQRGWALAQWAVAHAQELKIAEVTFGGRTWQARTSVRGWQQSGASASSTTDGDVRISVVQ